MDSIANNWKAVTRAADIFAAALPALITNLRRLLAGVPLTPKFPGCGAPPYWGPRLDSDHAKCRGISDRHYHTIPGSSFWIRCLSQGGSIDFQRQLFCLPADSRQTFRDFCPCRGGSKTEKKSWMGPPFGGNLMGKLKLWPQISRPLIFEGGGSGCARRGG